MRRSSKSVRLLVEHLEDRLTPSDNPNLVPPVLNSLPGAPATLYLDYNGHTDAVWGSDNNVDTPPFDTDGSVNSWSAAEIQQITEIWRFVAEDYAPFNINVSTVRPASFAPLVAQRVAIGGDGAWTGVNGILGIAHFNSFNSGAGDDTCFAFSANHTTNVVQNIAFTVSHESGHAFGLEHQSDYDANGNQTNAYSVGLTDGTSPLMGGNDVPTRNMWWFGPNVNGVTSLQDDVAVISGATNAFGYRADEAGGTNAAATKLTGTNANNPDGTVTVTIARKGVIAQMTDVDVYSFQAIPGPVSFKADVVEPYNNLDLKVELRDSSGSVLASDDPSGSFDGSVSFIVSQAGTYFFVVSSDGISSAATNNNYGVNVGSYDVTGTYISPAISQQDGALKLYGAVRWIYNARTKVYSATVTLLPAQDITGPFTIIIKLPHASIQWLSPAGERSGKNVKITFNNDLTANTLFRFSVRIRNPLRVNLGTFFKGLKFAV